MTLVFDVSLVTTSIVLLSVFCVDDVIQEFLVGQSIEMGNEELHFHSHGILNTSRAELFILCNNLVGLECI